MDFNYNKTILVTGASSPVGKAVALHLARLGFTVLATVKNEKDAKELYDLSPAQIHPLSPMDLTDTEQVQSAGHYIHYEVTSRNLPPLYGMVNIPDGGTITPLELTALDDFKGEFDRRIMGPVSLLQKMIPLLRETRGRIVWIAAPGLFPVSFMSDIHAPDFTINYIAGTLDLELLPDGIRNVLIRCACNEVSSATQMRAQLKDRLEDSLPEISLNRYKTRLLQLDEALETFEHKKSDPIEIVRAIETALTSRHPKTRYQVGSMAKTYGLLEKLPQSWVDRILRRKEMKSIRQHKELAAY